MAESRGSASRALADKLERLPRLPGVYIYRDSAGDPLYVGKAKSLRQRVRSYFQPGARHGPRIARMVSAVVDLEVIVVDSELEALVLESNLIKRERPPYNVILRDDKNFPYLKLSTSDRFPRASLVRSARLDGNVYAGPFLPASDAWRTLKLIQRHLRVATCRELFDGKRRPCLYYHLDQCLAPCAGRTDAEEYGRAVRDARMLLEGRHVDLDASLEAQMEEASRGQEYEKAARLRDSLRTIRGLTVRHRMASVGLEQQDYLAHHGERDRAVLQIFQVRDGKVQARLEFALDDSDLAPPAFYRGVILHCYAEFLPPPEIYLPVRPAEEALLSRWLAGRRGGRVRLRVPRRGAKKKLLDLVESNARLAFETRFRAVHSHGVAGIDELARILDLDEPPSRIECFDISNTQGSDPVAAMVVWEGGKPRKSEYRSFNVRGISGPDDYAAIAEAVSRRYRRLLAEDRRLPDLVVIDGGAGQLGAAVGALARVGLPMIPVVSIAKREEELFVQGRSAAVRLDRSAPALQLIQRLRDEAHRFALSRHRRRRTRRTLRTELTEIAGIGPVTAGKLLREFGSLAGVKRAAAADLRRVAGRKVAEAVRRRYGRPESS